MQEKQQLPGFQDMHTEQMPNQDCDPSSLCKRLFTPSIGCIPQSGSTPFVSFCFPALHHARISHYTSQTQGHLLLQLLLLGSRSSHIGANSCKSQGIFAPSLSKKLMYCMNWKSVQPPDTCMIFWQVFLFNLQDFGLGQYC